MTTHENGCIETPDWQPDPRRSPFEELMARAKHLPEPTWVNPGDLSRMSIEAMQRRSDPRCCPFEACDVCGDNTKPTAGFGVYPLPIPPNVILSTE